MVIAIGNDGICGAFSPSACVNGGSLEFTFFSIFVLISVYKLIFLYRSLVHVTRHMIQVKMMSTLTLKCPVKTSQRITLQTQVLASTTPEVTIA